MGCGSAPICFKLAVERMRIARLRVMAVVVERLPYRLDQRRFAVEYAGLQRAEARADARPAARPTVRRPVAAIHWRAPTCRPCPAIQRAAARHAGAPGAAPAARRGRRPCCRAQAFSGVMRAGSTLRGLACCRQRAGEILSGAVVGDEHDSARTGRAGDRRVDRAGGGNDMRQRGAHGIFSGSALQVLELVLDLGHSSASGSGPLLSMMTFHCLASSALSAM